MIISYTAHFRCVDKCLMSFVVKNEKQYCQDSNSSSYFNFLQLSIVNCQPLKSYFDVTFQFLPLSKFMPEIIVIDTNIRYRTKTHVFNLRKLFEKVFPSVAYLIFNFPSNFLEGFFLCFCQRQLGWDRISLRNESFLLLFR